MKPKPRKYRRYRGSFGDVMRDFFGGIKNFFVRLGGAFGRLSRRGRLVTTAVAAGSAFVIVFFSVGGSFLNSSLAENADMQPTSGTEVPAEPTPEPTPTPTPEPTPTPDPTLQQGMESAEVTTLQQRLMDLGYLQIDEPTQLYGPATRTAVEFFQRQLGIQQDGICGPETLALIYSEDAKPYTLLEGTEGEDVNALQARLMELGYLSKATGYYGSETIEAVMDFQERNDLGADGKTGEYTLARIYSADAVASEHAIIEASRRGNIDSFLSAAEDQLGCPYVWGAAGPNSFDCSGLVTYCLREAGSTTGRLDARGFSNNSRWEEINDIDDLQRGDLIFFYARKTIGHVGIVVGDGMMIDASSSNGEVVYRSYLTDHWRSTFVNGRRPW